MNVFVFFSELEFHSKLKFVQISFSTSTFDRIQKVGRRFLTSPQSPHSAGPSSQVCRPAVSYRRNHGAPHWLLSHQCGGDYLLHSQDTLEVDSSKIVNIMIQINVGKCLKWLVTGIRSNNLHGRRPQLRFLSTVYELFSFSCCLFYKHIKET